MSFNLKEIWNLEFYVSEAVFLQHFIDKLYWNQIESCLLCDFVRCSVSCGMWSCCQWTAFQIRHGLFHIYKPINIDTVVHFFDRWVFRHFPRWQLSLLVHFITCSLSLSLSSCMRVVESTSSECPLRSFSFFLLNCSEVQMKEWKEEAWDFFLFKASALEPRIRALLSISGLRADEQRECAVRAKHSGKLFLSFFGLNTQTASPCTHQYHSGFTPEQHSNFPSQVMEIPSFCQTKGKTLNGKNSCWILYSLS